MIIIKTRQIYFLLYLVSSILICGCGDGNDPTYTFDVHFVVLTNSPESFSKVRPEQLRKEVEILNKYFVKENRNNIINFDFKSVVYASKVDTSSCTELIKIGDKPVEYDGSLWNKYINSCTDARLKDSSAINFYIFDGWNKKKKYESKSSHGRYNRGQPYIILDWERLEHSIQSPEEHEMGHAFGLKHICVEGARINTSTNIMASAECGKGSGGKRDIGFDDEQVYTILKKAKKIKKTFDRNRYDE